VYELLSNNYVEDDDNMFRYTQGLYTKGFRDGSNNSELSQLLCQDDFIHSTGKQGADCHGLQHFLRQSMSSAKLVHVATDSHSSCGQCIASESPLHPDYSAHLRFCYSPGFLRWALQPPGYKVDWLLGVRVKASKKLVGFISAIPADIRVDSKVGGWVDVQIAGQGLQMEVRGGGVAGRATQQVSRHSL
jgi:hypothetical protein